MPELEQLKEIYRAKKSQINSRLNEFRLYRHSKLAWFYDGDKPSLRKVENDTNERLFYELVFCLLAANTSAVMAMKAVDSLRKSVMFSTLLQMQNNLKECGYRFPNKRAEYIYDTRQKLQIQYDFDLEGMINKYENIIELREFLVKNIKGFGYKEASHFMRNIGIFGLAILDKHILRSLYEFNVIKDIPKSLNRIKYLEIEKKYVDFAAQLEIGVDELDLLLWSIKNGKIMK